MKTIELSKREIESLKAILSVEINDLKTLQAQVKKSGQESDFVELGNELAVVSEILRKLED